MPKAVYALFVSEDSGWRQIVKYTSGAQKSRISRPTSGSVPAKLMVLSPGYKQDWSGN